MGREIPEPRPAGTFGRRRVRPRACVIDTKQHTRTFLIEALEELGFITSECATLDRLPAIVAAQSPDLLVLGLSADGIDAADALRIIAANEFEGRVLVIGPRDVPMVPAIRQLGEELALAMLPLLSTPFCDRTLRESLATVAPVDGPPAAPVDVAEAVNAGWLELWYQPKLNARTFSIGSAEALVRMRHPSWGLVPPAYFIPDDSDPHFRTLSDFVIRRAIDDWHGFVVDHGHIEIGINLPIEFLRDAESVRSLCKQVPHHPAFKGLIIETNSIEILRNANLLKDVAAQLRIHNIGLSIDNLGPSCAEIEDFPFVEIKVDREFVAGCSGNRMKQRICRRLLDFAVSVGARAVAQGVETRADFLCVREMGFDLVQGFCFAKPMPVRKFGRTLLNRPVAIPR